MSVMPEVGCDDTPTMPTMRAATATKRMPKTRDAGGAHGARQRPHVAGEHAGHDRGHRHDEDNRADDEAARQIAIGVWRHRGASRVASLAFHAARHGHECRRSWSAAPRTTVMMPPAATAPAPT